MTANGDGLNFDFLNEPAPAKKPEPPVAAAEEVSASREPGGVLDDIDLDVVDDGSSSSIFDEGSAAPVNSVDEIPDISEGDTAVLVRGRVEIQEFTEDFGAGPATKAPTLEAAGTPPEEALDLSSTLPDPNDIPSEFALSPALQNPLGGLFFNDLAPSDSAAPVAATPPVKSLADTDVSEFSFQSREALQPESPPSPSPSAPAPEMDDTHVTAEPPAISLDGFHDSGLSLSSVTSAVATTTPKTVATAAPAPGGNRLLLIVMGGYALVVTALCVMLLSMLAKAREASQLESLPDLKPIPPGKVAIYKINTELPVGHTLKLGEHQRYGNLRVEPLRVTRSPLRFQHFSQNGSNEDYDSNSPVLKLWVKFTNESKDQAFIPLDSDLLFRRHVDAQETVRANNFLVQKVDKPRSYPLVFVYAQQESSSWDMSGQQLGKSLEPGESLETYIPTTEEGIDHLKGDLLWRVQLRKGHSPGGYGVTTLVEVAFTAEQIQSDGT